NKNFIFRLTMRFGILELNSTDLNFGAGEDWSVLMDKNKTGIEFMKEGKWEEAAKSFMEAIEENPGDAVSYINFGNVLSAVGETEKALSFFKKAIEIDEGASAAYYSAGNVYFEQENFEEAKNMFEQALLKGLDSGDNYFMLGLTLMRL